MEQILLPAFLARWKKIKKRMKYILKKRAFIYRVITYDESVNTDDKLVHIFSIPHGGYTHDLLYRESFSSTWQACTIVVNFSSYSNRRCLKSQRWSNKMIVKSVNLFIRIHRERLLFRLFYPQRSFRRKFVFPSYIKWSIVSWKKPTFRWIKNWQTRGHKGGRYVCEQKRECHENLISQRERTIT